MWRRVRRQVFLPLQTTDYFLTPPRHQDLDYIDAKRKPTACKHYPEFALHFICPLKMRSISMRTSNVSATIYQANDFQFEMSNIMFAAFKRLSITSLSM